MQPSSSSSSSAAASALRRLLRRLLRVRPPDRRSAARPAVAPTRAAWRPRRVEFHHLRPAPGRHLVDRRPGVPTRAPHARLCARRQPQWGGATDGSVPPHPRELAKGLAQADSTPSPRQGWRCSEGQVAPGGCAVYGMAECRGAGTPTHRDEREGAARIDRDVARVVEPGAATERALRCQTSADQNVGGGSGTRRRSHVAIKDKVGMLFRARRTPKLSRAQLAALSQAV